MENDLERIIRESEIVILPEGQTIEDVLHQPQPSTSLKIQELESRLIKLERNFGAHEDEKSFQGSDDDSEDIEEFETFFNLSKTEPNALTIPDPVDFSYLLTESAPTTSSYEISEEEDLDAAKALEVNRVFKERLNKFIYSVQNVMEKLDSQFKLNNSMIERMKNSDKKDSAHFKLSYSKCGTPFFKDAHSDPAPINDDYRYRRNVLKEFFFYDQPKSKSKWKTAEKVKLIQGVKNQMVNFIRSEQSKKVCEGDVRKTRLKLQKLKFISSNSDLSGSSITSINRTINENYPEFQINWNLISFDDLDSNHSVTECMGMWFSYLCPGINREPFSDAEDMTILQCMSEDTFESWEDVAKMLNNRTALQTFLRYTSTFTKNCPAHVRWTPKEDELLMKSIEKYSVKNAINWNKIGQEFPLRNKLQCYNRFCIITRYQNNKKGTFSAKEDRIIIDYVSKYGEGNIKKFPLELLPGRSIIQIRNHYNNALKSGNKFHQWTREEDKKLVEYTEVDRKDWSEIAKLLTTHNRISCRTRYMTIRKFLDKNPNKSIEDVPIKSKTVGSIKKNAQLEQLEREEEISDEDENDERPTRMKNVMKFEKENPDLYRMMSTCFNLNFGARNLVVNDKKCLVLMELFNVQKSALNDQCSYLYTKNQMEIMEKLQKVQLEQNLTNELKILKTSSTFLMPPNFNTAIGLRAVNIKVKNCKKSIEDFEVSRSKKFQSSLAEFQNNFFSIFYWTAAVSKIESEEMRKLYLIRKPNSNFPVSVLDIMERQQQTKKQLPALGNIKKTSNL